MHVLWGTLGAALAEEKEFREYLDYIKWWMIMAQTHDGGFVVLPGRDYASTDHVYATRNFPTACAALILSLKEQRLQITGAARRSGAGEGGVAAMRKRPARNLAEGKQALLDESLRTALAELSHAGQLKPVPVELSKARSAVRLARVGSDGSLIFQALRGEKQASFPFEALTAKDHAGLARLVAKLRPDDPEAQAMAGIYLELTGDTGAADAYYERAGVKFEKMLDQLFE